LEKTFESPSKIYLSQRGAQEFSDGGFHSAMYMDLNEVLRIIQIDLWEMVGGDIQYFRTLEAGAVEEYVIIEMNGGRQNLLFRVWPVLYCHNKRLECKIYNRDEKIGHLIKYYLDICARTNKAMLVMKD